MNDEGRRTFVEYMKIRYKLLHWILPTTNPLLKYKYYLYLDNCYLGLPEKRKKSIKYQATHKINVKRNVKSNE